MELHEAIRRAYEGRITQADLAAAIGVEQPTISRWVRGVNRPSCEQLAQLEDAAGRPRGFALRLAGLVIDAVTTADAIAADPTLEEPQRGILLELYRSMSKPPKKVRGGKNGDRL